MAETVTIARPYAKAIFEHALSCGKLREWSVLLHDLAAAVLDTDAAAFIHNPASTVEQHAELLLAAAPGFTGSEAICKNLILTLAHNKRLFLLPDILNLFEALRADQEKTLIVEVISFSEPGEDQLQSLKTSLSKRLQREVSIQVTVDKSLIGGAIINAGDLVINGSVRDKLNKLGTGLAA